MELKMLLFIFFVFKLADSYKILGVFNSAGKSHYILASKLMKGLAEAGHDITMISPFKLKDLPKNGSFTEIILDEIAEQADQILRNANMFQMDQNNPLKQIKDMTDLFMQSTNITLNYPKVKKLLQSDQKFDAVIMEQFSNDALKVFSHIYNCPLILLSALGPNSWVNPTVGNPQPVSYVPHIFMRDFTKNFTLFKRAKNALIYIIEYLIRILYTVPKHEGIMRQAFPNSPSLDDLFSNVSLVLLISHTSLYPALPTVPNMVEIGGYFIDPPQKLPQDLQTFLDDAVDGTIYFSMGSNMKSKDLPEEKKKSILNVFRKLKQKVLWKFEDELPEKPTNVMIKKWLPQQDILAHPNIKLFITHGGLLSTTEAIYHGVPILAIPVFGDQPLNAENAVASGYGLKLDFNDPNFTEERFGYLLNELLENQKYKENAQRRSHIFHDRPRKPMETAVYWVEYIIRHEGAPHLRVAGVKMPVYKYYMLDVIGFLLVSILLTLYSLRLLFQSLFFKSRVVKSKKQKKH